MGRPRIVELTADDLKAEEYILRQFSRTGRMPPVRDIGKAIGLSSPENAKVNVARLREHRRLPEPAAPAVRLPFMGPIAAGPPLSGVEPAGESIAVPAPLAAEGAVVYRVRGDSMRDDLIGDGDFIVVRPREGTDGGGRVVVRTEDALALKKLRRRGQVYYLVSSNPDHAPIRLTPDMEPCVVGVYMGLFRLLKS